MKCRLVKLSRLSGNKASVYSVVLNDDEKTLFDKFLIENSTISLSEIKNIVKRLQIIGNYTGARYDFFKHHEGLPGDGICALFDLPKKKLRLYCIRYGTQIKILGGGGQKNVAALQNDYKLQKENFFLRWLSAKISERIKETDIIFINNGLDLSGNLEINDDE